MKKIVLSVILFGLMSQMATAHEFFVREMPPAASKHKETMFFKIDATHHFGVSEEAEPIAALEVKALDKKLTSLPVTLKEDTKYKFVQCSVTLPSIRKLGVLMLLHRTPEYFSETDKGLEEGLRKDLEGKGFKVISTIKYDKYAKLATAGGPYNHVAGQDLEVIMLSNPSAIYAGATVKCQVLLHGKPAAVKVVLAPASTDKNVIREVVKLESSADGYLSFKVPYAGEWAVMAIHLEDLKGDPMADKLELGCSYVFKAMSTTPSIRF